jgi:hypothetical protein
LDVSVIRLTFVACPQILQSLGLLQDDIQGVAHNAQSITGDGITPTLSHDWERVARIRAE